MNLGQWISERKEAEYKGICDDIFLTVMEYDYRFFTHGWGRYEEHGKIIEDPESVPFMEVGLHDDICRELFLTFVNLMSYAYDYEYIKLCLDIKCEEYRSEKLDGNTLVRLTTLRKLLDLSFLGRSANAGLILSQIVCFSSRMTSQEIAAKCYEYYKEYLESEKVNEN